MNVARINEPENWVPCTHMLKQCSKYFACMACNVLTNTATIGAERYNLFQFKMYSVNEF